MHFGQPLNGWSVPEAWSDMQQWAEIERRRKEVRTHTPQENTLRVFWRAPLSLSLASS